MDLVHLDADDRCRSVEARFGETLTAIGMSMDVLDSPVLECPGEARIRIVVDHQYACPAQMELLDGPQADTLKAAHDHVSGAGVPFH